MRISGLIDLHMHTTVSDGTDTPEEILLNVKKTGITVFSITDHDAVQSSRIVPDLLKEGDPVYIPGAEFSCRDEEGKYHILGYGYDPKAEPILKLVERSHGNRMKKVQARLDFLKDEFGFSFPEEEISALLSLSNPGKPHIGNLMVKYGYASTKEEAITDYINKLHFPSIYLLPQEAIEAILESGGIPVLAHPSYGSGDQLILGDEMKLRLERLKSMGLQGAEAYYSGFTPRLRQDILDFAEYFGLYVTAGSDYHGSNKLVQLGDTGLKKDAEIPEGMKRFLDNCMGYSHEQGRAPVIRILETDEKDRRE